MYYIKIVYFGLVLRNVSYTLSVSLKFIVSVPLLIHTINNLGMQKGVCNHMHYTKL